MFVIVGTVFLYKTCQCSKIGDYIDIDTQEIYMEPVTNITNSSGEPLPWLYDINVDDATWIVTNAFMIFTMQTGFGMLESGCVSVKNEVNIMMKNVVDIALGGLTYWLFGYAMSFGRSSWNNGFIALGDFAIDPVQSDPIKGTIYTAFLFQLSFATTATTIVSGAMAERCNFKAYCLFSFWNTLIYCIPAGWVWGDHGFLGNLGVVDIAGSGPVHLIGGSAAFAAAVMLGPRLGRYDNGIAPLPLGNPVNAMMGLFVLWWGWLAFNSGSTYGLGKEKWVYAAKAAVMTMIASFGGGCASLGLTLIFDGGIIEVITIINGVLGSLVAITAGCFLYNGWEALLVGTVGALVACLTMPLFDRLGVDDPVGASSVHGIAGMWGVIAVGLFADDPIPIGTTNGRKGLVHGGGFYLLGVQTLAVVCLAAWGTFSCMLLLWLINKVVLIRMDLDHELLGADLTEHHIKHGSVGISRAISALRPMIDTDEVEQVVGIGLNPGHDKHLGALKSSYQKQPHYSNKFSHMWHELSNNRNFGINTAKELFPTPKKQRVASANVLSNREHSENNNLDTRSVYSLSGALTLPADGKSKNNKPGTPKPMAWID